MPVGVPLVVLRGTSVAVRVSEVPAAMVALLATEPERVTVSWVSGGWTVTAAPVVVEEPRKKPLAASEALKVCVPVGAAMV